MNHSISIIIPVLNEAARIGPLVCYLREHGGEAVAEVLVVDGGSSDGTADLAYKAGAVVVPCNVCSRAAQMNAGARAAQAEVLYFIHADTLPPVSFVADIRESIASGHVMGCYRYRFDSPRFLLKINAFFNRFHWLWCQGGDKTFFIQREILMRWAATTSTTSSWRSMIFCGEPCRVTRSISSQSTPSCRPASTKSMVG